MERRRLGQLEVSAIGLGCTTMTPFYGDPDPASAIATIRRAAGLGIDFLDTSDAYSNGRNGELISQAVDGRRDEYVIASKFGNLRHRNGTPTADGRPEYVTAACERSPFRRRGPNSRFFASKPGISSISPDRPPLGCENSEPNQSLPSQFP
jgi:aryl-alcohol dehydrogenase-like predicted oxidoreductase